MKNSIFLNFDPNKMKHPFSIEVDYQVTRLDIDQLEKLGFPPFKVIEELMVALMECEVRLHLTISKTQEMNDVENNERPQDEWPASKYTMNGALFDYLVKDRLKDELAKLTPSQ